MFATLALALLSASADVRCTRWESATTVVTVCGKRTDAPAPQVERPMRWHLVFVANISRSGWATVLDSNSDETWIVPAWQVGGPAHVGTNVKIFTRRGAGN